MDSSDWTIVGTDLFWWQCGAT